MLSISLVKNLLYRTQIRFASSSSIDIADFIRGMSSIKKLKTESSSSTTNKPRHVRMKERGRDPGLTSRINLQIISNGYADTSKSLILNNDQTNYMFNCGEGTQRTLQEKNTTWEIKFSKTKHLFMTRKSWDTMGGLLGVSISLKDAYLNEITFHAPCDVISLLKHWKGLEAFPNVTLEQHDYDKSEFKDDCFKINAIPLRPNNDISNFDTKQQRLTTSNNLISMKKFPDDLVYAYLCETHPFPATLSAELCAFHKVPPTELRARLKNGEDVTLPDGRLIRSKDVTLPGEPPVKVLKKYDTSKLIELRSSSTLEKLWSLTFDTMHSIGRKVYRVCLLKYDEWLVIDHNNSRLLHVSKDGKVKAQRSYEPTAHNAVLFGSNILAIRTANCLNYYRV
ncbi:unnamed protein product [Rotaria sp. Silwood2]|nr:unnamed protein product [Rotaria sp. Silwood2]